MPKSIHLRQAIADDAPFLVAAEKTVASTPALLASRPQELDEKSFHQKILALSKQPNARYIVAEDEGRLVGHAFLEPMGIESVSHIVRLTIVVHSGHAGRGIGRAMLSHLIEWAKAAPRVEKIELNVRATNLRAIVLYQKFGFKVEGQLQSRIRVDGDHFVDDLTMGLFVKRRPFFSTVVSSAVGWVVSTRSEVVDDRWDQETVSVQLDPDRFSPEALAGLDSFSHVEVIFFMDQVPREKIETKARHPRNELSWPKVGIFAQRGKNRPNQIGTCICRILSVEGLQVHLQGLDAVNGTPVLDLKPWVKEFGPRGEISQPSWMTELMKTYWS